MSPETLGTIIGIALLLLALLAAALLFAPIGHKTPVIDKDARERHL